MTEDYTELKCSGCHSNTGVWYVDCGAPFYQMFVCESCKVEQENNNEEG